MFWSHPSYLEPVHSYFSLPTSVMLPSDGFPLLLLLFSLALQPSAGYGLLVHEVSWSQSTTRHSRQHSSGRVIISSQRPVHDNTPHTQQTNVHAPGGIRTQCCSRRAAVDLRLRPRGHWDRLVFLCTLYVLCEVICMSLFSDIVDSMYVRENMDKIHLETPDNIKRKFA
jgi:hypothetical protein